MRTDLTYLLKSGCVTIGTSDLHYWWFEDSCERSSHGPLTWDELLDRVPDYQRDMLRRMRKGIMRVDRPTHSSDAETWEHPQPEVSYDISCAI